MRPFLVRALAAAVLATLALAGASASTPAPLTPREQAGKRLYLSGESPSGGEIVVRLGRDGATLPGGAAPCGSCHGADGQGRPEGGVRPPAITWSELVKPLGHAHAGGRRHGPFDDASLGRALRDGVDPAGNPLDVSMPRYTLGDEDLGSLAAYLRRIEEDLDPGISGEALRIGTVLPTAGSLADVGVPMRAVLSGWFDALNRRGGVHGRRMELVVAGYDSDRATGLEAARELLREGRVLAFVSGFHPAAEPEIAALLAEAKVPSVGPFSVFGPREEGAGTWDFHPAAGLREQARALARFSLRNPALGPGRLAVIHAADPPHAAAARAAVAEATGPGSPAAELIPLAEPAGALAGRLARGGYRGAIVLAPDAAFEALARELAAAGSALPLLASGTLSGRIATQAAGRHRGPVFLAFPGAPADESAAAARELARLREGAGASARSRASQASAMVDAVVLVEGLKRAGRSISRERLVSSLEALHAFETGLSPPVTFGPDRRVGVQGAYVVEVDPAGRSFRPTGGFISLE